MINALLEFRDPLTPLTRPLLEDELVYLLFKSGDGGHVFEGQGFRDVLFLVVGVEGEGVEVEAGCGGEGHVDLVAEEGVGDVGGRVVVDECHDDAPDHLADLVVDEALSYNVKDEVIFIQRLHLEPNDIPLGLGILGPQVFRVIMKVMASHKLPTARLDLFNEFLVTLLFAAHLNFPFLLNLPC